MSGEFSYSKEFTVDETVKKVFEDKGYILVRSLLSDGEINKLKVALEQDEGILTKAYYISDGEEEKNTRMCLWNHPGNDITGMVGRCEKVAGTTEQLMGGEMYHYHTKLMMKEAHGGGSFQWHQDYGYWYDNGCLYPDMATCFIAVDNSSVENGCLQIIPGTHKAGRITHHKTGGQMAADQDRVEHFQKILGAQYVEMKPGDALFFHCNLLHKSAANPSPNRRWAFLIAYNMASNNPIKKHHHPRYIKLNKVPNEAIEACTTTTDLRNKGFYHQSGEIGCFTVEDEHLN